MPNASSGEARGAASRARTAPSGKTRQRRNTPKSEGRPSPPVASIVVSDSPRPGHLQPAARRPMKIPRKTIRYECVGGPRDGDVVLIQRTKHQVRLDGALYEVRLWAKMDENGQRLLWKREALVWEGLLVSDSSDQPTAEPSPPQPVDWPPRAG